MSAEEQAQTRSEILRVYENRDNLSVDYSIQEKSSIALDVYIFSQRFYSCQNRTPTLPTRFTGDYSYISWFCHNKVDALFLH